MVEVLVGAPPVAVAMPATVEATAVSALAREGVPALALALVLVLVLELELEGGVAGRDRRVVAGRRSRLSCWCHCVTAC